MTASNILLWFSETTLAVSALIILVLIIRKPFALFFGARMAYALWLAPVVRLFMPELAVLTPPVEALAADVVWMANTTPATVTDNLDPTMPGFGAIAIGAALFVWVTVAIAWFSINLETQSRFMRAMLASSKAGSPELLRLSKKIAESLKVRQKLRIRICDSNYGPAVIGLLRPVIFLPENFETAYTDNERRLALTHEIAHIARGDMAATLAALAFKAIQWPNPLAHFAYRYFRTDQEAACDAYIMARQDAKAASDYASAIVKSASSVTSSPAYGLSLAHPVKERLMLLKNPKHGPFRKLAGAAAVIALSTAGLAVTASYGYAANNKKDEEKTTEVKKKVKKERRVIVIENDGGTEDIETMVIDGGEFEMLHKGDGEHRMMRIEKHVGGDGHDMMFFGDDGKMTMSHCSAGDGEGEPVKLEWTDEEGDDNNKHVSHSVICLTGEEASDPKKRVEALRKAIDKMEANAKKEEARRKKMIAGLRKQLREMEKKK